MPPLIADTLSETRDSEPHRVIHLMGNNDNRSAKHNGWNVKVQMKCAGE